MAPIHQDDESVPPEAPGAPEKPGFEKFRIGIDEEHLFGVHPDGVGPTLGGDLSRPNPGNDLPPDLEDDDEA